MSSGTPSLQLDQLLLLGSQMTSSSALYFQGTGGPVGGAGAPFGDGLRCADGSVIRLAIRFNVAGSSAYPLPGDASISQRGQVAMPGVRTYLVWYRNAEVFCTAPTFNRTNGVRVAWLP